MYDECTANIILIYYEYTHVCEARLSAESSLDSVRVHVAQLDVVRRDVCVHCLGACACASLGQFVVEIGSAPGFLLLVSLVVAFGV